MRAEQCSKYLTDNFLRTELNYKGNEPTAVTLVTKTCRICVRDIRTQ